MQKAERKKNQILHVVAMNHAHISTYWTILCSSRSYFLTQLQSWSSFLQHFTTQFLSKLAHSHLKTMVKLKEWWRGLFLFLYICSALFVIPTVSTGDSSCSVYSSLDTDDFWVSVGRCIPCIQSTGCGFCQSTLQCLDGTLNGPSDGFPCPTWMYSMDQCPALPHCETFNNCGSCATQDQCAWCASEGNTLLFLFI